MSDKLKDKAATIEAIKARYMDAIRRYAEASRDLRQLQAALGDECDTLSECQKHMEEWDKEARAAHFQVRGSI